MLDASIDYPLGRNKVDPRNGCVHHWIPVSRCQFLHGKTAERWEVIARNSDPLNGLKSDGVSLETSDSLPVLQVYLEHCRLELWPNVERHNLDKDWIHNSILEFYSCSVNCISTLLVELLLQLSSVFHWNPVDLALALDTAILVKVTQPWVSTSAWLTP